MRLLPCAIISPKPRQCAIMSTASSTASPSPHFGRKPPVCSAVSRPRSTSSMTYAIVMPVLIVSSPQRAHSSFAFATAIRSATPHALPNAPSVSYSGPP